MKYVKLVKLTLKSDKEIWINARNIQCILMDDAKAMTKVVMLSGYYYFVKESVEDIIERCESE